MRTALPSSLTAAERRDFYQRVLADVRSLPSVTSAAYMGFLPITWPAGNLAVTVLLYVAAAALAMVMTLVSSLRPALRAATIDPAATIRQTS